MSWLIERATSAADLDAMLAVEEASFTNPWTRDMYVAELGNEGVSFFFVARDQTGKVVGFCACWHVADELHINNLAVVPDCRRLGIASELLRHVLAECARGGARLATLEVRRSNAAALRLYERFGFAVSRIRPGYYQRPDEDALVLELSPVNTGDGPFPS